MHHGGYTTCQEKEKKKKEDSESDDDVIHVKVKPTTLEMTMMSHSIRVKFMKFL